MPFSFYKPSRDLIFLVLVELNLLFFLKKNFSLSRIFLNLKRPFFLKIDGFSLIWVPAPPCTNCWMVSPDAELKKDCMSISFVKLSRTLQGQIDEKLGSSQLFLLSLALITWYGITFFLVLLSGLLALRICIKHCIPLWFDRKNPLCVNSLVTWFCRKF